MLIQNAKVCQSQQEQYIDLRIVAGKIVEITSHLQPKAEEVCLDAAGALLTPGFTDLHVHFRDPGLTYKEDIQSGAKAAAHGGFTRVCAMPNVQPVPDTVERFQKQRAHNQEVSLDLLQYAPITKQLRSTEVVDMPQLQKAGAVAFTNDGVGVQTAGTMMQAMQEAKRLGAVIVAHAEDESLLNGGAFHLGSESARLYDAGISSESEYLQIMRDLALSYQTKARYHVCHLSTKEGVDLIRQAKQANIPVTCEVTPHHLLLCDEDIPKADPLFKMNPPLRSKADQAALWAGLLDGTIDCIATDHAPHSIEEKSGNAQKACFGIVGLDLAFPLLYTYGVKTGRLSLETLISCLTERAEQVFHLPKNEIKVGAEANLALFDLEDSFIVDEASLASKGKNTPFLGQRLYGKNKWTLYQGEIIYDGTKTKH